jgi:hypothetical protein
MAIVHPAFCVIRASGFRSASRIKTASAGQNSFSVEADSGYKTFQIPHVQSKNGRRIFLHGIRHLPTGLPLSLDHTKNKKKDVPP